MNAKVALYIFLIVLFVLAVIAARFYITLHILGTFKFDNSGETYRCRMEFDDLDDVERHKFAIVKIKEADLSLPGERKSQH